MEQKPRVSAKEIIETIIEAMHAGIEPLAYTALAPSIYQVHLAPEDHERLIGIFTRIIDEAKRKLDEELARLNASQKPAAQAGLISKFMRRFGKEPEGLVYESAEGDWFISFQENTDEVGAGTFDVSVELALPPKYNSPGAATKRITFRRTGDGETRRIRESAAGGGERGGTEAGGAPSAPRPAEPAEPADPSVYAKLSYEDDNGSQVYYMTKDTIKVGRGGRGYWVHLRLSTSEDVSREHLRLRRDAATGKFYLSDLSSLGTTVNGERVESSVEVVGGEKRDKNVEVELPPKARIVLADVVGIDFDSTEVE